MQQTSIERPEIKLVGIGVRTSYSQELDKMKGHIFPCVQRYFHKALFERIPNRSKPGVTYCAYTGYESDYMGAYTYFIGEEVATFPQELPEGFQTLVIPSQRYMKFTTAPAPLPEVVENAWKAIWNMPQENLGGKRLYQTDFEIYDERAADHQKIVLDLYIGIERERTIEIVKKADAVQHANSPHCTVYEYPMKNSEMNIGVAEIEGRYPDQGYCVNHRCSEMGYILKGSGKLIAESGETTLSAGDVVYIPSGKKYYWEGTITVVVPCTPPGIPSSTKPSSASEISTTDSQ